MDDIKFFPSALTDDEIHNLYTMESVENFNYTAG